MSNKSQPTHTVSLVEGYESNGEKRNRYTDVGAAWLKDDGFISVQLRDNLAISGRFIIRKPKEKVEGN